MERRVVITGLGCVTPIGNNVEEFWKGIEESKCGVDEITSFDTTEHKVHLAGEVKNFNPTDFIDSKEARKMARFTQLAVCASKMALEDSNLTENQEVLDDAGVFLGVGIGGFEVTESSYKSYFNSNYTRVAPLTIPEIISNEAAGNICIVNHIHGPAHTICTACASGTDAIGTAFDQIRSGRLDVVLAGGTESAVNGFTNLSFGVLQALSSKWVDEPTKASRPFDKDRDGFVMGEGATILVLEEYEHAKARGAKIYAEVAGYGATTDGYHLTAPNPDGVCGSKAMTMAMKDAGIKPEEVVYYNAHGTSTHKNDSGETMMLKNAFGEHAYKLHISSTKSMTGHCLGNAGSLEAFVCIKSIEDSFIPPTINLDNPDIEGGCDLDYTPNKGISIDVPVAMSGNFGFGGHNGILVFRKVEK